MKSWQLAQVQKYFCSLVMCVLFGYLTAHIGDDVFWMRYHEVHNGVQHAPWKIITGSVSAAFSEGSEPKVLTPSELHIDFKNEDCPAGLCRVTNPQESPNSWAKFCRHSITKTPTVILSNVGEAIEKLACSQGYKLSSSCFIWVNKWLVWR